MESLKNIDKLHSVTRRQVSDFSMEIISVYGKELKSITVYGSALGNNFNPKKSDINMLVILDSSDLDQLKKCVPIVNRHKRRISPLLLTKKYIESSQDVYPMEFLGMKERYLVIYGEDVLKDIKIDRQYLRLECEQQLKGCILKLKQGFLRSGPKGIEPLIGESKSSVLTIFKNLIRISGMEPPLDKEEIVKKGSSLYKIDCGVFGKGEEIAGLGDIEDYFGKYVGGLESLADNIDRL